MSLTGQGRIQPNEFAALDPYSAAKINQNWGAVAEAIAATRVRGSSMADGSAYYGASSATQKSVTFAVGPYGNGDLVLVTDGTHEWMVTHLTAGDGQLKLTEATRIHGAAISDYTSISEANLTAVRVAVGGSKGCAEHGFSARLTVATGSGSTGNQFDEPVRQTFVVTAVRLSTLIALAADVVVHVEGLGGTPDLTATLTAGNVTQETTFSASNSFNQTNTTGRWVVNVVADANSFALVGVAITGYWC